MEKFQKLLDRIESRISLFVLVQGGSALVIGAVTGWIASFAEWIEAYGFIGLWIAFLAGAVLSSLVIYIFSHARFKWVQANAVRAWKEVADDVNPLLSEFNLKRIKLMSIADPVTNRISNKKFTECQLLGSATIVVYKNCNITGVNFQSCDIIVCKENAKILNAIALEDVKILGGTVAKCTIMIPPYLADVFSKMGADFIAYAQRP